MKKNEEDLDELKKRLKETNEKYVAAHAHLKNIEKQVQKIEDIYEVGNKTKEWLSLKMSSLEEARKEIFNKIEEYDSRQMYLTSLIKNIENGKKTDVSIELKDVDRIYDTIEKRKELVDELCDKFIIEDMESPKHRKITCFSKRLGEETHWYEYLSNAGAIRLFYCYINPFGEERKILEKKFGRQDR